MATRIEMKCADCGRVSDRFFDHVPPGVAYYECCMPEPDRDRMELSRHDRVWGPVSIGRVEGAGRSPSR